MPFIGNKPTAVPLTSADIQDGTIALADLSATGTKDATTFLRGDNTFAEAGGGVNTPAFYARMSADQSLSNNTYAKVNFDTEDFDIGSCYDHSSNYRFTVPSGQAGKYFIGSSILLDSATVSYFSWGYNTIYKNGSAFVSNHQDDKNGQGRSKNLNVNGVYDLAVGDYLEVYAFISLASTSAAIVDANDNGITSYFYGYKIIE